MSRINILLFGKKGVGLEKPGGAARAMFEYANHLIAKGHQVEIFISACNFHPQQYKFFKNYHNLGWNFWKYWEKRISIAKRVRLFRYSLLKKKEILSPWFDLKAKMYLVSSFAGRNIPDADCTIITDWWMLLWTKHYSSLKGKIIWFIHTTFFIPNKEEGRDFLSTSIKKITVSSFMKRELESYGAKNVSVLLNGVNLEQFYNKKKILNEKKRIGMVYFDYAPFKGVEDGLVAFEIAKKKHPEIELVMFGVNQGKRPVPSYCEIHFNLKQEKLREIYSSCDIFLFPSRCEAFGMPPMEAMACQCAVVGTTAGGMTDYAVHEETALLSIPGDIEGLASNLIRLIEDDNLLKRFSLEGYKRIRDFSWDQQTERLEQIISEEVKR